MRPEPGLDPPVRSRHAHEIASADDGSVTALGLNEDLHKGLIDRFRSLPMARSAVLAGARSNVVTRGRAGESPTRGRRVVVPPAGTKILAVLAEDGGLTVDPDTRELQIEISPAGSEILKRHAE